VRLRSFLADPHAHMRAASVPMVEVKVQSLGLDRTSNTPVVILQETAGSRVLPIWIGPGEASAIAMELAGMKFSRPLTHDLFASVIAGLGGALKRVMITKVVDNTYYAELIIQRGSELFSVDARPSDSIAIALRLSASIYTTNELLEHTSIDITEAGEESAEFLGKSEEETGSAAPGGLSPEELREYLRRMHPEDFGRFNP
jgi:bifunctional DNase/RNase